MASGPPADDLPHKSANCSPWPVGYDAGETMRAFVGVAPTLFIIGSDGRIAWNDDRSRFGHDTGDLPRRMERAIDEALLKHGG